MMRKCIISLLFSTFFLSFCSQNILTAQVYNQRMDKRFDPNFKTEQAYYKYIHKISKKLYGDYHHLLEEMMISKVPKQMELLRKDNLSSLKEIRHIINNRNDYDPKFPLNRSMNILIDKYEDIYNNEIKNILDIYFTKESEASKIFQEKKYQKQVFGIFTFPFKFLKSQHNSGSSLPDAHKEHLSHQQEKLEEERKKEETYAKAQAEKENIYRTDLKELASTYDLKIDTLPIAKNYYTQFNRLDIKAKEARSTFEKDFNNFEANYNLLPEVEDDFDTYSLRQQAHYSILKKLDFMEEVNVYILRIFISAHKLESIDKDFRLAIEKFDIPQAQLIKKYMAHHAEIEFRKLKNTSKFDDKEGDFRSSATRLIKYYLSSGKNTYPKIMDFITKNKDSLTKEKENQEEFDRMAEDKTLHKSKEAYKEYLNFPPPQKNTIKLELLIKKYRERLKDSTEDFTLSLEELREMFTIDFDPLDN